MAHAYETIAHGGDRVSGSLASDFQPVGIQEVDAGGRTLPDGHHHDVNDVTLKRVLPSGVAATETSMLETVLAYGTAKAASIGQFAAGKTGTTSNFGDAWFVGWNKKYTVAVWVGYPDKLVPMTTEFGGKPVFGGTYPALIWHDFMLAAMSVEAARANHVKPGAGTSEGSGVPSESTAGNESGSAPTSGAKHSGGTGETQGGVGEGGETGGGGNNGVHVEQAPATPTPNPTPSPAPSTPATPAPGNTPPAAKSEGATGGVSPGG
jgi:penicillin-binding protein 1A